MKKKELDQAFQSIKPDEETKGEMLHDILNADANNENKKTPHLLRPISVIIVCLIMMGSIIAYKQFNIHDKLGLAGNSTEEQQIENNIETEDGAFPLRDQFQIDDRHYHLLRPTKQEEYGFPQEVDEKDIGEKLTTITDSIDQTLLNKDVYHYLPAQSEAVVAVAMENDYQLYEFYNFKSYEDNQDESGLAYLQLYGIEEAADLIQVQFGHQTQSSAGQITFHVKSEINDPEDLEKFHEFYAALTNDSDLYFERLFQGSDDNDRNDNHPIIEEEQTNKDQEEQSSPAFEGTAGNALEDSIEIRIYQKSGLFIRTTYYPNIHFISRHSIDESFVHFLEEFL